MSADRAERARIVCQRLTAAVAEVAPPGLGLWSEAWSIVAYPSEGFLAALDQWQRTGAPEDAQDVQRSANDVVAAWAGAAEAWEAAGRPEARPRVHA